jgi:hypothetical protein
MAHITADDLILKFGDEPVKPVNIEESPWRLARVRDGTEVSWEAILYLPAYEQRMLVFEERRRLVEWVKSHPMRREWLQRHPELRRAVEAWLREMSEEPPAVAQGPEGPPGPDGVVEEREPQQVVDRHRVLKERYERLAGEEGLAPDSAELFDLAAGKVAGRTPLFRTLVLYDTLACRGNAQPITGYMPDLSLFPFTALSCRSSGLSTLYSLPNVKSVNRNNPNLKCFGITDSPGDANGPSPSTQIDVLPFVPQAAETQP